MKLKKYIKTKKIKQCVFAKKMNTSTANISRWANSKHIPSVCFIKKIQEITGGQVGPADFYNLEELK